MINVTVKAMVAKDENIVSPERLSGCDFTYWDRRSLAHAVKRVLEWRMECVISRKPVRPRRHT